MFNWLREFLELKYEFRERKLEEEKVCQSCETLKMQLAIANDEKRALLDRILEKPKEETQPDTSNFKPVLPRHTPWNVRRRLLETEDREKARILKEHKIPTEQLEKELELQSGDVPSNAKHSS